MNSAEKKLLLQLQAQVAQLQRGEAPEPLDCAGTIAPEIVELCRKMNRLSSLYAETLPFILALADGDIDIDPPAKNLLASPFKRLQASLRHLTWQTGQIAAGDYQQRVNFMGAFSSAFNSMVEALEEKHLMEQKVRDSEATLRAFLNNIDEAIFILDLNGSTVRVNQRMLDMYGVTAEEALNLSLVKDFSAEGSPLHLFNHHWSQALDDKKQLFEWTARHPKDGSEFEVRIFFNKIRLSRGAHILVAVSDISPLKQVEIQLRQALSQVAEEKAKSEAIIAAIGDGLTVQDRDFRILHQNQVIKDVVGDHQGEYCFRVYEQRDEICPHCPVDACFSDGKIHVSERHITLDGKNIIFENTASPIRDSTGNIIAAIEMTRDITERKETEQKNLQISNLYQALSSTNRAIIHSCDLSTLLQESCALAVRHGGFCLAGIATLETRTGLFKPIAYSGTSGTDLESSIIDYDRCWGEGSGPTEQVAHSGKPYVCNDFAADPISVPWREPALASGIRAWAVFPLTYADKTLGVFKVFSEQKNYFGDNILDLLLEMAENISHAIDNFSREERRKKTAQALRENEERLQLVLEGSNDGFWDWDIASRQITFSRRYSEMLGYAPQEIETSIAERQKYIHPEDWPSVAEKLNEHLSGSTTSYEVEFRLKTKAGDWEWVFDRGRIVAHSDAGEPLRMAGTTSIITERKRQEEALNYVVTHDSMTGLFNRAYWDAESERLAQSRQYPISIVMADIDGLKLVNDGFGHLEGDQLIKLAARALRESFRPDDIVARIGGDEFAVLLPKTSAEVLKSVVKRVLQCQDEINSEERAFSLSISIGSATAETKEQFKQALHTADSQMYYYKFQRKTQK